MNSGNGTSIESIERMGGERKRDHRGRKKPRERGGGVTIRRGEWKQRGANKGFKGQLDSRSDPVCYRSCAAR